MSPGLYYSMFVRRTPLYEILIENNNQVPLLGSKGQLTDFYDLFTNIYSTIDWDWDPSNNRKNLYSDRQKNELIVGCDAWDCLRYLFKLNLDISKRELSKEVEVVTINTDEIITVRNPRGFLYSYDWLCYVQSLFLEHEINGSRSTKSTFCEYSRTESYKKTTK